jgi:hypothetical protein
MANLKKIACSVTASCVVFAMVSTASAQGVKESSADDGYGYEFEDDPLAAGGFGPNDSRIRVRRGAQRSTLIKPRTQFITELLKSVENL